MKRIPLTQGKHALVDDIDYDYLMRWKWCYIKQRANGGYAVRTYWCAGRTKVKTVYMHRIIAERMGLDMSNEIDHKHRNKLNNRRHELRPATRQQQTRNIGLRKNNTSGYKGVFWHRQQRKWYARIRFDDKLKHLGYFDTKIEAVKAYNKEARKRFGKYAYLNPV